MPDPAQAPNPTAERDDRPSPHGATIDWGHGNGGLTEVSGTSVDRDSLRANPYAGLRQTRDRSQPSDIFQNRSRFMEIVGEVDLTPREGTLTIEERMDVLKNLLIEARKPDGQFQDHSAYLAELNRAFSGLTQQQAYNLKTRFNQEVYPELCAENPAFSGATAQAELINLVLTRSYEGGALSRRFDDHIRDTETQFAGLIMRGGVTNEEIQNWAARIEAHDPDKFDLGVVIPHVLRSGYDVLGEEAWHQISEFLSHVPLQEVIGPEFLQIFNFMNGSGFGSSISPSNLFGLFTGGDPVSGGVTSPTPQMFAGLANPLAGAGVSREGYTPTQPGLVGQEPDAPVQVAEDPKPSMMEGFMEYLGTLSTGEWTFAGVAATIGTLMAIPATRRLIMDNLANLVPLLYPIASMAGAAYVLGNHHEGVETRVRGVEEDCLSMLLAGQSVEQRQQLRTSIGTNTDEEFETWLKRHLAEDKVAELYASSLNDDVKAQEIIGGLDNGSLSLSDLSDKLKDYGNLFALHRLSGDNLIDRIAGSEALGTDQERAEFLLEHFPMTEDQANQYQQAIDAAVRAENPDFAGLTELLLNQNPTDLLASEAYFAAYDLTHEKKLAENFSQLGSNLEQLKLQFALAGSDLEASLTDLVTKPTDNFESFVEKLRTFSEAYDLPLEQVTSVLEPHVTARFETEQLHRTMGDILVRSTKLPSENFLKFLNCCREADVMSRSGEQDFLSALQEVSSREGIFEADISNEDMIAMLSEANQSAHEHPEISTLSLLPFRSETDLAPVVDLLVPYIASEEFADYEANFGEIDRILNGEGSKEEKSQQIAGILASFDQESDLAKYVYAKRLMGEPGFTSALDAAIHSGVISAEGMPESVLRTLMIQVPEVETTPVATSYDVTEQIASLRSNFSDVHNLEEFVISYEGLHAAIDSSNYAPEDKERLHYIYAKGLAESLPGLGEKTKQQVEAYFRVRGRGFSADIQNLANNALQFTRDAEGKIISVSGQATLNE